MLIVKILSEEQISLHFCEKTTNMDVLIQLY